MRQQLLQQVYAFLTEGHQRGFQKLHLPRETLASLEHYAPSIFHSILLPQLDVTAGPFYSDTLPDRPTRSPAASWKLSHQVHI